MASASLSDYLAAERTLLAWIRTGLALMGLGAFINLASGWSHFRLVQELDRGTAGLQRSAFLGVGLAAILAVIGLSMAIYVASVRDPQTSLKPANPASTQ